MFRQKHPIESYLVIRDSFPLRKPSGFGYLVDLAGRAATFATVFDGFFSPFAGHIKLLLAPLYHQFAVSRSRYLPGPDELFEGGPDRVAVHVGDPTQPLQVRVDRLAVAVDQVDDGDVDPTFIGAELTGPGQPRIGPQFTV